MRGVFPGSFDPPTVAHVAIAEAAVQAAGLLTLDLAVSRTALGKDASAALPAEARVARLDALRASREWLGVVVTDARLVADIARGYDAVVMGADKWAQVCDPAWYGSVRARDAALATLPRVLVVPRGGLGIPDGGARAEVLRVDPALSGVSSTLARTGRHEIVAPEARRRVVVDAMNVIGSRPDGWWRDRDGAVRKLLAAVQALARRTGDRIAVVLDGRPIAGLPEGVHDGVLVAYARRAGRDAADDRIVEEVARDRDPAALFVVTSDHALRERVRALGAQVEGAGVFLTALGSVRP